MKLYDKELSTIHEDSRSIRLSSMAFSKLLEIVFLYLLGTVSSIMLSDYSLEAVAISNISNQIINFTMQFPYMVIIGSGICMSLAFGKNDRELSSKICGTSSYVAVVISLIAGGLVLYFAKPFLILMNLEPHLLEEGVAFLRILAGFFPVTALMTAFNNHLVCNGYASYTLLVGLIYNLLNVFFCYLVLYTPLSLPVTTLNGVALAGRLACLAGLLLSVTIFVIKKCPFHPGFIPSAVTRIFKVGVPAGMNGFSYQFSQLVTTGFIASFGAETVSTKVYISSVIVFSSIISSALGHSGSILIGRYRGMKNFTAIEQLFRQDLRIAVAGNLIFSTIVYLLHVPLIGLFTSDAATIAFAGKVMLIDILVQVFRAVNNVSDQALNANGDVRTTLSISVTACWLFGVCMSYLLGIRLGMGLMGVWLAFMMDEGFKALMHLLRWRSRRWMYTHC